MAGYAAAFGLGTTVGPSVGALAARLGPIAPLIVVAGAGAIAGLLIWRFVPEATPPRERAPRPPLRVLDPRLRATLAFGVLSGIVTATQLQFIGFYTIDELGLGAEAGTAATGIVLTCGALASLFAQVVLIRRFKPSPRRMMRAAPPLILAGFAAIVLADTLPLLALGAALSGVGFGLSYPAFNADASLKVGGEEQGGAAGLAAAAGASGFVLSPPLGSLLYGWSHQAPFLFGILIAIVMALIAWTRRA
jgi:MFS family permease